MGRSRMVSGQVPVTQFTSDGKAHFIGASSGKDIPARKARTLRLSPPADLTKDEKVALLAEALADPTDYRSPDELAMDLSVSIHQVRQLVNDPRFMEPIVLQFHRNLAYSKVLIMKSILRQVKAGDLQAARLALQSLAGVPGGDVNIQVNNQTNIVAAGPLVSQLTDEELDRDIHRLFMDTHPDDVTYGGGKVRPTSYEVEDAIEVECTPTHPGSGVGRDHLSGEETEVTSPSVGETEEDGG